MRVTEGMISATILNNIQLGKQRLDQLQQEISTGLKVSTPGDDPVAAQQVLQLKGALQDGTQYARNITTGNAWLTQADSSMDEMGNVVTRAMEIAQEMASGTNTATDRASAASEVQQLKDQLIQLGNSQVAGKYIFGGFVSDKPPFDTATGAYVGTDDAVNMEVDRGTYVAIGYSGGKLLRGGTPPGSSGADVIGTLNNLITALSSNDTAGIQGTLPALDASQDQILAARADVGARMNRVQNASDNLDSMKVSLNAVISDNQNADLAQVASDLVSQQTAYQAALAASAKTSQLSLLDYLK
jgi:flagellar hook-associated protein 3 FlgL